MGRERLVRRAIAFVVGLGLILLAFTQARFDFDDHPLASLPQADPEVGLFRTVADRYGALDTILLGVDDPELFTKGSLERIRGFSRDVVTVPGVAYCVSFTELPYVSGGVAAGVFDDLVPPRIPDGPEALAALRDRVLSYDVVAGQLVSGDGTAALIPIVLDGARPAAETAREVEDLARDRLMGARVTMGGAPAVTRGISMAMTSAAPVVGIAAIVFLAAGLAAATRRLVAVVLAATATAVVAACSVVPFGWLGIRPPPTVALAMIGAAVPALLAAAFVLSAPGPEAARARGRGTVVTGVACAGILAALAAALVGEIAAAIVLISGAAAAWILCTLVLPVLVRVRPDRGATERPHGPPLRMGGLAAVLSLAAILTYLGVFKLHVALDPRDVFPEGTGPRRAQEWLEGRFGGTGALLAEILGDVATPEALDAFRAIESAALGDPSVRSVTSVLAAVRGSALVDGRPSELPPTAQGVRLLLGNARGQASLRQILRDDWSAAAAVVRLDPAAGEVDGVRVAEALSRVVPPASRYGPIAEASDSARDEMTAGLLERLRGRLLRLGLPPAECSPRRLRALLGDVDAAGVDRGRLHAVLSEHFAEGTWVLVADPETNEPAPVGDRELREMIDRLARAGPTEPGAARSALLAAFPAHANDAAGLDAEARQMEKALAGMLTIGADESPDGTPDGPERVVEDWAVATARDREAAAEAKALVLRAATEVRHGGTALPDPTGVALDVRVAGMPLVAASAGPHVVRTLTLVFLVASVMLFVLWGALLAIRAGGRRVARVVAEAIPLALVSLAPLSLGFGAAGLLDMPVDPGTPVVFAAALSCTGAAAALLVLPWTSPVPRRGRAPRDALRVAGFLLPATAAAFTALAMVPLAPVRTTAFALSASLLVALVVGRLYAGVREEDGL